MGSWRDVELVALLPKRDPGGTQWVRVGVCRFGKRTFADIREVFRRGGTGTPVPTRKGICLDYFALRLLADALVKAVEAIDERHGGMLADYPELAAMIAARGPIDDHAEPSVCARDQTASTRDDRARRGEETIDEEV